ncbi:MAG: NagC family transcriptional regulator [Nanoarchaeota archaeon]|nr:NagC family transcriptional regulator [Nanoarchaeota archaeon]
MLPGMDMKKLKKMMKDMENIPAERVIIEGPKKIVIENPQVVKINLMGQETFQIVGEAHEVEETPYTEEDVKMVMEQTGKSEEEVRSALDKNKGDIAKTILELK